MTDQTVEEVKDAGSDEVKADPAVQTEEEGSSIKDKVEHVVDSVKDKLTGGDDKDSDAGSDASTDSKE